jgi:hypothetical protein
MVFFGLVQLSLPSKKNIGLVVQCPPGRTFFRRARPAERRSDGDRIPALAFGKFGQGSIKILVL